LAPALPDQSLEIAKPELGRHERRSENWQVRLTTVGVAGQHEVESQAVRPEGEHVRVVGKDDARHLLRHAGQRPHEVDRVALEVPDARDHKLRSAAPQRQRLVVQLANAAGTDGRAHRCRVDVMVVVA